MKLSSTLTACVLALIGIGIYFSPPGMASNLRGVVTDLLRPGHLAVLVSQGSVDRHSLESLNSADTDDSARIERLKEELEFERVRNRALQIRLAQRAERQSPALEISAAMKKSQRLILRTLIDAAVLGDSVAEQWRSGKLLDQGSANGLRESELVLSPANKPQKSLIDYGEDADISTEDALLLGRCVIGKVEHVGRWTSSFQLVTDAHYRGRAQLIRETADGLFVFESQGILKGQGGPLCRLEGVPAEKSVRVQDAVYTADRDGVRPTPLYYGQVVEATLGPDDREWTILVKPVPLPSHLTVVQVLRMAVNPERLAVK